MKKQITLLLFSLGGTLLLAGEPSPLAAQTDGCVTASCHPAMGKDVVVHNPVKEGMCTTCHQATVDSQKPTTQPTTTQPTTKHPNNLIITLTQQGSELCAMCHEAMNKKKVIHAPVMGGDCTFCHNPHQSSERGLLKEKRPQLCLQCHAESLVKNMSVHKPVGGGNCSACHDMHQSDLPKLLVKEGNELCLSCHSAVKSLLNAGKTVHPAVEQGCLICHSPHSSQNNSLLSAGMPGLCAQCHEPKNTKKTVHAPIMGGDCTSCHNPHRSPNKAMLKDLMPALCFQCHPDSMMKKKVMHPPVAAGDCSACHDNHQSDFPNRLVLEGNALCFQCHPDKEEGLKTKKTGHYPVKQSCILCHNPHGTEYPSLLSAPVPDLCASCHPNEVAARQRSAVKHEPMTDGKSCRNCHDPHFSDQPRLLVAAQMELCLSCHNKELETGKGKIANMKALLDANKNAHGPIQGGDCVSCHNPHGSGFWRILARFYPAEFYSTFTEEKYDLCFGCHDKAAITEKQTKKKTGFRNGEQNLHFVHVNKIGKGRTCRACHEVHADNGLQKHVKQNILFSGWTMPMNFVLRNDGGSCLPGCHGEKRYAR